MNLETSRLLLIDTPEGVLRRRLETDDFHADVATPRGGRRVHFPPQWPGDALDAFPSRAARFDLLREGWDGTVIHKADGVAVGMMGFKGGPDAAGTAELGYGLNADYRGRGLATEGVLALIAWGLRQGVRRVTARTTVENFASRRVLEKAGLLQVGTDWSAQDGDLIVWELPR